MTSLLLIRWSKSTDEIRGAPATAANRKGDLRTMAATWAPDDVRRIDSVDELHIAAKRLDGTLRRWLPIWVVCVNGQVYVRTWYRRDTGWFAHVLASRRASIRVSGLQADITVEDLTAGPDQLRADIDTAYYTKYGRYGTSTIAPMVTAAAAATTLRLNPEHLASHPSQSK